MDLNILDLCFVLFCLICPDVTRLIQVDLVNSTDGLQPQTLKSDDH